MVLNLDPEISEEELRELFEAGIGPVKSVLISTNAAGTQTFGEVLYHAHEHAVQAIEEFHGLPTRARAVSAACGPCVATLAVRPSQAVSSTVVSFV